MFVQLISKYYSDVEKYIRFGGTAKESSIRRAFENLLNEYTQKQNLMLIPELPYRTPKGKNIIPDGTLKDALRLDWGYWESKDSADDLEAEIAEKFNTYKFANYKDKVIDLLKRVCTVSVKTMEIINQMPK